MIQIFFWGGGGVNPPTPPTPLGSATAYVNIQNGLINIYLLSICFTYRSSLMVVSDKVNWRREGILTVYILCFITSVRLRSSDKNK